MSAAETTLPPSAPSAERIGGWLLAASYLIGITSVCIAGGGAENVGQYLLGELQHIVEAISGRQPLARNNGDPTLPAYFTLLSLTAVLFLIHAILRGLGRVGVMSGRSLWRWSAVHAVVSALWVASVVYPQVFLVGWGIVHRAWAGALAGYALQFLVAMTMLSRKTG